MKTSKSRQSSRATLKAAKTFTRRIILKRAAIGAVLSMGPWVVRDAFSSSGNLRIMMWSDYLPDSISKPFIDATGIHLSQTLYGSDEELLHRVNSLKGRGFDLICPTASHMGHWRELGLLQSWDMKRVPVDRIDQEKLKASLKAGTWETRIHHLPFVWGSEGLAWRTDKWFREPKDLTYGDLWRPEMKGKIMGSPLSMLMTLGLYLDHIGEVPSNRMLDAYKDEDSMRRIWDKIVKFAIKHRSWVKLFWEDAEGQISGFKNNGVVLGQTWDGPPTRLSNGGEPVIFHAPVEGALGWLAGLSLPVGAENIDQVYEFLKFQYTPKNGARLANASGYTSCAAGADKLMNEKMKKKASVVYGGGAMDRMWWWPAEEPWYYAARAEYRDKFVAA